jgi:hypothetical protein
MEFHFDQRAKTTADSMTQFHSLLDMVFYKGLLMSSPAYDASTYVRYRPKQVIDAPYEKLQSTLKTSGELL